MSTFLGIDIGTTAVKVAVVRTAYRKVQLVGLSSVEITSPEALGEAIAAATRAAMGPGGGFGDAIAVSLAGAKATVRMVGLPLNAQKQIGDVLPFELESQLPFDLAEAVFDWRLLPGLREKKGEELGIIVGIAKTSDVTARIELLRGAIGVEPERVGIGAFPIANMLPFSPTMGEGVVVLVDLGTESSDILILKNGEPAFARTIGIGTKGLPETAPKLARELRTTIAAHRSQGGDPPTRLFLCGGGAYVSGAESFLGNTLGIPTEVIPVPAIELAGISPDQVAILARFAKAIGLALGFLPRSVGLNLRKGALAFERGFTWIKERVPLLAGLAAVILVSFLFGAWAQLYAKSKEKRVLEQALGMVTKEVLGEETESASRANDLLAQQTAVADEDPLPHADSFDVMVKLSERIPQSITHDIEELDIQKGHVMVHGIVPTVNDSQQIKDAVAEEPCFSDAKITRTTAQPGSTNQKYLLEFDIKCPEDQKGGVKKPAAAASASAAPSSAGGK